MDQTTTNIAASLSGLIVQCLFAWWGVTIASAKGYAPAFGALMGFFCSCFGILVLYLLPRKF